MRLGKLDNSQLEELVLNKFVSRRSEVLSKPCIGVDCAAVAMDGCNAVLSMDPITSAAENLGGLTVHINCNDAAAAGAEPIGLMVTLLAPPKTEPEEIARVADELSAAAQAANIDILGGHTEVTDSVTRMVTCATVLAKVAGDKLISPSGMCDGDDIIVTKWVGLEGTAIIASDFADRLKLEDDEFSTAKAFFDCLSVVPEGTYAARHGAHAMHDITEGGVLGAVWEMSQAAGIGICINSDTMPIHAVTASICKQTGIDPLRLISSGCMLIACANGDELCRGLESIGVKATRIGKAQGSCVCIEDGSLIEPPQADEIYKLWRK